MIGAISPPTSGSTTGKQARTNVLWPRSLLLAGTALASGVLAIMGGINPSYAACQTSSDEGDPVSVLCANNTTTTNTTNTNDNTNTSDRRQLFDADIAAQVNAGVIVNGFGLRLETTKTDGGISVINNGTISTIQNVDALSIIANGGLLTYDGTGSVNQLGNCECTGLFAQNSGNGSNIININGTIGGGGLQSTVEGSGTTTVNVNGDINGTSGRGIFTRSVDGTNTVNVTSGTIQASFFNSDFPGVGITAVSTGAGNVSVNMTGGQIGSIANPVDSFGIFAISTGTGNISVTAETIFSNDHGVLAVIDNPASAGNINVTANGPILVSGPGNGIEAVTNGTGNITVTNNDVITALNGIGIHANGASGSVTVQNNSSVNGFSAGINAENFGSGSIAVTNTGSATGSTTFGIRTDAVDGATTITNSGNVSGGLAGISAVSIGAGPITINNTGTVTGGNGGISIFSDHAPVQINTTGTISGINFNGIRVDSLTGSITVHATSGTVSGSAISPNAGIFVGTGGAGNITIDGAATITGFSGILAGFDVGASGSATVNTTGNITGTGGFAIDAGGPTTGAISVQTSGIVSGVQGGINVFNIGTGLLSVVVNGGSVTTTGGNAISAQTTGGANINIANSGTLTSPGTDSSAVIAATSTTGAITITNNVGGVIQSLANSPSDLAIATAGGPATVANAGTLTGRLLLGGSSNVINNTGIWSTSGASTVGGVFNNLAGGTFTTSGTSTISGVSSITNAGTFNANGTTSFGGLSSSLNSGFLNSGTFFANGTTDFGGGNFSNSGIVDLANGSALNNLSNFQNFGTVRTPSAGTSATIGVASSGAFINAGSINLQNNFAGDRLTLAGNYVGIPGSQLLLDFAPQSNTADLLLITGNASGSTAVAVNNLTPGVPFTVSPTLVQVNGTLAPNTFTLGTLQNFGAVDVVLFPGVGNIPGSVGLSLATVPSAAGLSGAAALQGAQTIAFQSNSAVLDQVSEVRELQRRGRPIGAPIGYAEEDPWRAYGASLPSVMKAPPVAPVAAPAPAAARLATWGRVYGDFERRDNNVASFSLAGQTFTRDLSYDQRGGGLLAGADVVLSNLTSAADGLIFGAFGGYITARVDFNNAGVTQNFSGGTVGAKATYVNGGFFADAIVKVDLLSLDINAIALNQTSDLTNFSALGNVGYKFDLSRSFYVEPTAGFEYVQTNFSESPLLTATTVPLLDGHVTRLRAGARFGTEFVTNNIRIEPSVLPLVYYIAEASGLETFTAGGPGVITFPSDEGKVFGEIQASVNFLDLTTGWSGFVRADLRFGEDLFGGSGKAGVRYTW